MGGAGDAELVGIGAFAQLTGLSIDALRHYHDVGLLIPAVVDPTNGYRRYRLDQSPRARTIARLRELELPLTEVGEFLDARAPSVATAVLLRHRRRLRQAADAAAHRIEQLDQLIEGEPAMSSHADASLRAELLEMFEAQQTNSRAIFEQTRATRPDRFVFELPVADRPDGWEDGARMAHEFAVRLDAIVEQYGWPGRALVGEDGAGAAWAIAQHADDDNDLRQRWLPRLRGAVDAGDVPGFHLAALTDRVLLRAGRPQRYGTLVEPDGETWRLRDAIEDPEQLDDRRREIGLPPVSEFLASLPAPDTWYAGETAQ